MRGLGLVQLFLLGLLIALAVACSSESDNPGPTLPTPGLFEVLTPTPPPAATSTPQPTATAVPVPLEWFKIADPPLNSLHNLSSPTALENGSAAVIVNGRLTFYHPESDEWVISVDPEPGLWQILDSPIDGLVGFAGGQTWYLDSTSGQSAVGPELSSPASIYWLIGAADGRIYVGHGPEAEFDELYSPEFEIWGQVTNKSAEQPFAFFGGGISVDHNLFVGIGGAVGDAVFVFDFDTGTLVEATPPTQPRQAGKLVKLPEGKVLLYWGQIGERRQAGNWGKYEVYDPAQNTWSDWIPASQIDEDLQMSDAWVTGSGILGRFIHVDDPEVLSKLGLFDAEKDEWRMFDHPHISFARKLFLPFGENRLLLLEEKGFGPSDGVSAWMTTLP